MKILLPAYACEPGKGSEPGVGWNWAMEIAKLGHDVWVLTRANNEPIIERELQRAQPIKNLHFLYFDLPQWLRRWKKGKRGVHLYYLLWQIGVYRVARQAHLKEDFDLIHHVTFVSVRQPSFMGNLGIPFIFGPVAGGERAPWRLRWHYGIRGYFVDFIRDVANLLVRLDPLMRRTFRQAERLYVTSSQTMGVVPACFHHKTRVQLAIGLETQKGDHLCDKVKAPGVRILFVGQFLYWKGMGLGIQAFAQLVCQHAHVRLTMVGKGVEEKRWKLLTGRLKMEDRIDWVSWVDRKELGEIYRQHDIFLFPSLHDSGGMVVLEAMANGLPVVCLNLGGPGVLVDDSCGAKIDVSGKSEHQVVGDMAVALAQIAADDTLRQRLRAGALQRAATMTWKTTVAGIYNDL